MAVVAMTNAQRTGVERRHPRTRKATVASATSRSQAARERAADKLRSEGYVVELPGSIDSAMRTMDEWHSLDPSDLDRAHLIGIMARHAPGVFRRSLDEFRERHR